MKRFDISDTFRILNLCESEVSIRGMNLAGPNCAVMKGTRGNTTEPAFRGSSDHVTLLPLISASGRGLAPPFALHRTEKNHSKQDTGKWKSPTHFLP